MGIHLAFLFLPWFNFPSVDSSRDIAPLFVSRAASHSVEKLSKAGGRKDFDSENPLSSSTGLAAQEKAPPGISKSEPEFGITSDDIVKNGNLLPPYPREAIERGWEGTVELKLKLSKSGEVIQADLMKTSGYPILDLAALKACRQWKFDFPASVTTVVAPVKFVFGS